VESYSIKISWDSEKAKLNLTKHGVSFEEAITVFANPLARIFPDDDHSEFEQREIIVGHSARHRLLFIAFAENEQGTIRIISARRATKAEQTDYEKNQKK